MREALKKARARVDVREKELRTAALAAIEAELDAIIMHESRGLRFAEWWLTGLEAPLEAYRKEQMLPELAANEEPFKAAGEMFPGQLQALARVVGGLPIPGRGGRIRAAVNACIASINSIAENGLEAHVRQRAVELYTDLITAGRDLSDQVRDLIGRLEGTAKLRQQRAEDTKAAMEFTHDQYILAQDISDRARRVAVYEQTRPKIDARDERAAVAARQELGRRFWERVQSQTQAQTNRLWTLRSAKDALRDLTLDYQTYY